MGWGRVIEVPKLVYELRENGTMVALGSPQEVSLDRVKDRVSDVLTADMAKTKDIWRGLSEPRPSQDQVLRALEALADDGKVECDPPMSEGKRRGVTYRWRWASTNLTSDRGIYRAEVKLEGNSAQANDNLKEGSREAWTREL